MFYRTCLIMYPCRLSSWEILSEKKNLGFLFVLDHGAEEVVDLAQGGSLPSALPIEGYFPVTYPTGLLWNPYPSMLGLPDIWPTSFPTQLREVKQEALNEAMERVPAASIGIVQNLPDSQNPQQPLKSVLPPLSPLVALGLKTFAPLTKGTTLFTKSALWALFAPKHETSALLRGLLVQPLLWRLGLHTAFSASISSQEADEGSNSKGDIDVQLLQVLQQINLTSCATVVTCLTLIYSQHQAASLPQLEAWLVDLGRIGYQAPQLRSHRQFAYLTQGAQLSSTSNPRIQSSNSSSSFDTFYLSFSNDGSGDLFFPNSTFQQGRNALLRLALSMEVFPGYAYFVFTDEDVRLTNLDDPSHFWKTNMSTDPWVRMEVFVVMTFFHLSQNLSSGVLAQVHTDGWVWEVWQLDPDEEQLWHIFNHHHP